MRKNILFVTLIASLLFLGGGCSVSPVHIQTAPQIQPTPIIPSEARNVPLPNGAQK